MNTEFENYIKDTRESKELGNAYQFTFDKMENEGQNLSENQYILTAVEYTIKEWENWLGIPFDSNLTLDERRQQVLLKRNMKPPYTLNNMKKQIYGFTGVENEIIENRSNLSVNIDLSSATKGIIKLVHQYMKRIKPANVVYSISVTPKDLYDDSIYYMSATITKNITVV